MRIFTAGFSLPIAVGLSSNHSHSHDPSLFRVVRQFVALLRSGWHPYTSEKLKRGVAAFVRRRRGERFCPLKPQGQRRETLGGWEITQPPGDAFAPDSARFCLAGLRQNAQGKGRAEGSKKEQDKAVTSPPDTPARSASRVLRFFTDSERSKSVLRNVP